MYCLVLLGLSRGHNILLNKPLHSIVTTDSTPFEIDNRGMPIECTISRVENLMRDSYHEEKNYKNLIKNLDADGRTKEWNPRGSDKPDAAVQRAYIYINKYDEVKQL